MHNTLLKCLARIFNMYMLFAFAEKYKKNVPVCQTFTGYKSKAL